MVRRLIVPAVAVSTALVLASTALAGVITPVKVQGGPGEQFRPSSNGTHIAWSQWRHRRNDAFVRELGTTIPVRVNASQKQGMLGSFVQGTDQLVYQQFTRRRSDIFAYDVSAGTRTKLGSRINSPDWEWWPVASADLVLFLRDVFNDRGNYVKTQLLLADRTGGPTRRLIPDIGRRTLVAPGYAGTDFVAWTRCARTCNAYYYNVVTRVTNKLPLPDRKAQYAPSIDEGAGQIYYVRSGLHCGQALSIRRSPLGAPATGVVLADLPPGIDTDWVSSLTTNPDTMDKDLYFGRWNCAREDSDVYALQGADVPAAPIAGPSAAGAPGGPTGPTGPKRPSLRGASPQHP